MTACWVRGILGSVAATFECPHDDNFILSISLTKLVGILKLLHGHLSCMCTSESLVGTSVGGPVSVSSRTQLRQLLPDQADIATTSS